MKELFVKIIFTLLFLEFKRKCFDTNILKWQYIWERVVCSDQIYISFFRFSFSKLFLSEIYWHKIWLFLATADMEMFRFTWFVVTSDWIDPTHWLFLVGQVIFDFMGLQVTKYTDTTRPEWYPMPMRLSSQFWPSFITGGIHFYHN